MAHIQSKQNTKTQESSVGERFSSDIKFVFSDVHIRFCRHFCVLLRHNESFPPTVLRKSCLEHQSSRANDVRKSYSSGNCLPVCSVFSACAKGKRSKISCIHRLRRKAKFGNKRICFRRLTHITPFVLLKLLARLPETRSSKQNAVGNLRSVYMGQSISCFNKCIIIQQAQRSFRS